MDGTILGLPVEVADDLSQPVEAVAIIKGLDTHGRTLYWIQKTDGLSSIEAIGMLMVASDEYRTRLVLTDVPTDDE